MTFAWVRPMTPMRLPASCSIFLIAPFLLLPFSAHSTAKFLRMLAIACAFFGNSMSPRTTARSVVPALRLAALDDVPSVMIGRSLMYLRSREKICVID